MTGTLAGYLRRRVGAQIFGVLLAIVALLQLLGLMDATSDILERGLGAAGIGYYSMMRLPFELTMALPLAALLGGLAAFQGLARSAELTAARAAGVSLQRVMLWLLPVPVILGALQFYVADQVLPRAEVRLSQWWQASAPKARQPDAGELRWLHVDDDLVAFRSLADDARQIEGLTIYQRDADAQLTGRLTAARARWTGDGWQLQGVQEMQSTADATAFSRREQRVWEVSLKPADLLRLDSPQPRLTSGELVGVITGGRPAAQPISYYQMALYRAYAMPLEIFIMVLLAAPALRSVGRGGQGGLAMIIGLALGLAFLLVNGMAAALGSAGRIPPLAAAVVPPVLFVAVGLTQLRRCDRL